MDTHRPLAQPGHPVPRSGTPLLDRALARVAGSDLREGNAVQLLRNAAENYPAWLEAIAGAKRVIHFENFIIANDQTGRLFAEALGERARAGVRVRVLYDWLGCAGRAFPRFWSALEAAGVEVRVFNAPRLTAPFWVRRDHRKVITIDGQQGFVSGLCIADSWLGSERVEAWRDTGIALRGPVVADLDAAFAESWALAGSPLPEGEIANPHLIPRAGDVTARVIRGEPGAYRTYRLDQFIAATARRSLWLTDAYFVATTAYVQSLADAARDGVDVRLLVPGSSDVPFLQPIVQAGYRPLIEAGIRVFEWNGSMLHAKTAVADGRWARVGSTNLNPSSWATNWEIDVAIEDEDFAGAMEAMFVEDLVHATEIVPTRFHRVRVPRARRGSRLQQAYRGSMPRLAAGAIALGHTAGAAIAGSRTLSSTEARSAVILGGLLIVLGAVLAALPGLLIAPVVLTLVWIGAAMLLRAWKLRQASRRRRRQAAQAARRAAVDRSSPPGPP